MKDSKSPDSHDEIPDKNFNKELLETKKNKDLELISSTNNELDQKDDSKINQTENIINEGNNTVKDKTLKDNIKVELDSKFKVNTDKKNNIDTNNSEIIKKTTSEDNQVTVTKANKDIVSNKPSENIDKSNNEIIKDKNLEENKKVTLKDKSSENNGIKNNIIDTSNSKINIKTTTEDNQVTVAKAKADKVSNKSSETIDKSNNEIIKDKNLEENKKVILKDKSSANADINSPKDISTTNPVKAKTKPVKEPPIEKKPFLEFVNDYLIPEIKNEFKLKGKEINKINLQKTHRPIAEDICWVIYCEINDTCNFWLSFEKDDITSLKSFSLCKNYEKPSIIESFLIDEKKITLKLIISRILQRLNGQKLIGAN